MTTDSFLPKLKRTFFETATSAAVWFPLGNTFLAIGNAEPTGIVLMAATTALTTLTRARSSWRNDESKTHYNILSGVNAYLAGSVLYHGVDLNGLHDMTHLATQAARDSWFAIAAFGGWSYCHRINGQLDEIRAHLKTEGREESFNEPKRENKRNVMNVFASASAVHFDPRQMPFLGLSLVRSVFTQEGDAHFDGSLKSYFKKHVTPPRLMSLKYATGVAITWTVSPLSAAAQACWTIGQNVMDPERNKDFLEDTKLLFSGQAADRNPRP